VARYHTPDLHDGPNISSPLRDVMTAHCLQHFILTPFATRTHVIYLVER
jgi:hypothetical protein